MSFFCYFCTNVSVHNHHVIPKEFMGGNSERNLLPLCASCHRELEHQTKLCISNEGYKDSIDETLKFYDQQNDELTEEGERSKSILEFVRDTFIPEWDTHKKKTIEQLLKERKV